MRINRWLLCPPPKIKLKTKKEKKGRTRPRPRSGLPGAVLLLQGNSTRDRGPEFDPPLHLSAVVEPTGTDLAGDHVAHLAQDPYAPDLQTQREGGSPPDPPEAGLPGPPLMPGPPTPRPDPHASGHYLASPCAGRARGRGMHRRRGKILPHHAPLSSDPPVPGPDSASSCAG